MWPLLPIMLPIAAEIAQNVVQGINTRKARMYDSPANQIKRYREAGMPMAAASNINGGGGFTTQASIPDPSPSIQANLGAGLKREIDRKQIDLLREQIRSAKAAADLAGGQSQNMLNPQGVFAPTNQGLTMQQEIGRQALANKQAEIVNTYMPSEKNLGLKQMGLNLDKTAQDIKNAGAQYNILVSEGSIKKILAEFQPRMSAGELNNLVLRNTGLKTANDIANMSAEIMRRTKEAQITVAINRAIESNQQVQAQQLSLLLQALQNQSAQAYYRVKARYDESFRFFESKAKDFLYLGMFNQQNSTYTPGSILNLIK